MRHLIIALSCLVIGVACTGETATDSEMAAESAPARDASAELRPTEGNSAQGSLKLTAVESGVHITGTVQGLNPNAEHGFHIHEKGDCSAPDASSAGAHFNPTSQPHGHPEEGGPRHLGDMVNLRADDQGIAQVDTIVEGASLGTGRADDVLGKAIVVHEKPDDYTSQPSGDSGGRIACGVIR